MPNQILSVVSNLNNQLLLSILDSQRCDASDSCDMNYILSDCILYVITTTLPIISPEILGGPEVRGCSNFIKDLLDVTLAYINRGTQSELIVIIVYS